MKKLFILSLATIITLSCCNSSSNIEESKSTPKSFTEIVNGVTYDMVYVESDTVLLGATFEQIDDAGGDEYPEHFVSLNGYYIGKYEVTQDLWFTVMGEDELENYQEGRIPISNISWDDIQLFIQKLNNLTKKTYRLPTEAEWENAARGGSHTNHYKFSGNDSAKDVACCLNYDGKLHVAGSKKPNELGIYDMSGNLWEWCQDWYGPYQYIQFINPQGNVEGTDKILKGGCFVNGDFHCRVSRRYKNPPDYKSKYIGFRLAL